MSLIASEVVTNANVILSNESEIKINHEIEKQNINNECDMEEDENSLKEDEDMLGNEKLEVSDNENDDSGISYSAFPIKYSEENKSNVNVLISNGKYRLIDTESSNNEEEKNNNENKNKKLMKKKQKKRAILSSDDESMEKDISSNTKPKFNSIIDSESSSTSSEEESSTTKTEIHKSKSKISSNSETSDEENKFNQSSNEENIETKTIPVKNKKNKKQRSAAKGALDNIMALQSEQQRLHREQNINIPYHKPKKHTLQDFLKRRIMMKPVVEKSNTISIVSSTQSPKMSAEQLEEFAKLMEKRASDAKEFFKSESEDEEIMHDNISKEEVVENDMLTTNDDIQVQNEENKVVINEEIENIAIDEDKEKISSNDENENDVDENCINLNSKPIIQEVVNLPKCDVSLLTSPLSVKRLLIQQKLENPKLSGTSDMLIDLDSGEWTPKPVAGIDNLLKRLMSTRQLPNKKGKENLKILSTENGQIELKQFTVNLSDHDDNFPIKDEKPRADYIKLKKNLRTIMIKKRLNDLQKRQEIEKEKEKEEEEEDFYNENYKYDEENTCKRINDIEIDEEENTICLDNDEEKDNDDEEKDNDDEENTNNCDDNNSFLDAEAEEEKENENGNSENDEEENESENENISEVEEEEEEEEEKSNENHKSRIIRPTSDDESEDELNLSKPTNDENNSSILQTSTFITQIPITQAITNIETHENELLELCSGKFNNSFENNNIPIISNENVRKILSSEDEMQQNTIDNKERKKILKKKRSKRNMKLGFSDDEDDDENIEEVEEEEEIEEDLDDIKETFIDYDSDENEIVVEMSKNDRRLKAQNFVEDEAALSESDWGSADEDEKNLDSYDIELGDEEEFDREKLKTELAQIHARKMLDEDIRNVRKIQDLLFEDEEKDGVGRQRRFKWKNAESGFLLNDENKDLLQINIDGTQSDDDDTATENLWRKVRYEREQLLQQQRSKDLIIEKHKELLENVQKSRLSMDIQENLKPEVQTTSAFLISKATSILHKKTARASFLVQDKQTLEKLAGLRKLTGTLINDDDDTISTINQRKSVVFTTTTPEQEILKRKAKDALNDSNTNRAKMTKLQNQKCFIDQLL